MEKLVIFCVVASYFTLQGFLAGSLFEDDQPVSDFISEVKTKANLGEIIIFGPALFLIILIKLCRRS